MRLIDYTYLQEGLAIISVPNPTSDSGLGRIAEINALIDFVQPQVLKQIMGDTMYDAFMADMAAAPIETRWSNLANQIRNSTTKTSLLVNFVYIEWKRYSNSMSTEHGDYSPQEANMMLMQDWTKNVNIYNNGIDLLEDLYDWIILNVATYPEFEEQGYEFDKLNRFGI
jgi:hypothetical protein